jgi:hypothetical protein
MKTCALETVTSDAIVPAPAGQQNEKLLLSGHSQQRVGLASHQRKSKNIQQRVFASGHPPNY